MDILGISLSDWVGYAAMFALLVSFIMKEVKNLRIINSVGCGLFVVYGFMLSTSWPIVITNSAINCINFF